MLLEKIKVLEKVPFDGHILVIIDPISFMNYHASYDTYAPHRLDS